MRKTAVVMIALVIASAGVADADRTVNESRPLDPGGQVEISNISGEVNVIGWSGDAVIIEGRLEEGIKELAISSGGSRVSIEARQMRRRGYSAEAFLTVKIPTAAGLEVETISADITVDGVDGEVELESVSGKVEVSGRPSLLEAASVSGNVVATATAGRSELESVSGDVIVRSASGRLEAGSVSGNIEIEGGELHSLNAETVSGSIFCAAVPSGSGRFSLETMSGTVEMVVSESADADYYVETYSGDIRNTIGPKPRRTDDYGPGKELRFSTGSGGGRVVIESFSGSVKIRTD